MRGFQPSMNQTEKVRLRRALEKLESLSSNTSVIVGGSIPVNHEYEDGILKGHGTSEVNGEVVATVCGLVTRVDKLVYVRSLRVRYKPNVGDKDIIAGRLIEAAADPKRRRPEINYSRDALLTMNLPDGIPRRRQSTALNEHTQHTRASFEANDVVCAQVHGFRHDDELHLKVRSMLGRGGQMVTVPPYLVKKRREHLYNLDKYGIDLILGCNGIHLGQ